MSLSKILEEIKVYKPIAQEDISGGPRETYAGREGRKRNAVDRMKDLKEKYIIELRNSAVFILVAGSARDQFVEISDSEFKCFSADPESFYKDLANRIPAELYANRTSSGNLFDIMGRHLEDKANEMQISGYPQLILKQQYIRAVNGKDDFVKLIKQAINEQVGSEIVGINTIRELTDRAIDVNHGAKITPIVMSTDDEEFVADLKDNLPRIGANVFIVVAGEGGKNLKSQKGTFALKDVNKESVEKVLTNIKKLCKNR